jgi:hypothetical protein
MISARNKEDRDALVNAVMTIHEVENMERNAMRESTNFLRAADKNFYSPHADLREMRRCVALECIEKYKEQNTGRGNIDTVSREQVLFALAYKHQYIAYTTRRLDKENEAHTVLSSFEKSINKK